MCDMTERPTEMKEQVFISRNWLTTRGGGKSEIHCTAQQTGNSGKNQCCRVTSEVYREDQQPGNPQRVFSVLSEGQLLVLPEPQCLLS